MSVKFAASAFSLCLLASGLLPRVLLAATSTASVRVTAMVQAGCVISATSSPSANHLAPSSMANPAVSVTCTMATPYIVDMHSGARLSAAALGSLTGTVSALKGTAFIAYPSRQSALAVGSAHAITVVVTY